MNVHLLDGIPDLEAYAASLDADAQQVLLTYLKKCEEYKTFNKMKFFEPEDWQQNAIALGATQDIRMVSAGNRLGKTFFSTYETAIHATGKYPDDWNGLRFDKPINIMVMGWDWTQLCRPKATQELLLGKPDERGSGWLPREDMVKMVPKVGLQNTVSTVYVKHYDELGVYDGDSRITFDVYSAGMGTLMGTEIDFALLDEQVPADIFAQVKRRLWSARGSLLYVATPEHGRDEVIDSFWNDDGIHHDGLIRVTLWDSSLFTDDEKKKMYDTTAPWARSYAIEGIPSAGSGSVFAGILKETLLEPVIDIKPNWKRMSAADLGYKDDMAFTFIAKDPKTGIHYLYKERGYTQTDAVICASGVKPLQEGFIPMILPADGDSERGLGDTYRSIFKSAGLIMTEEQARNWHYDPTGKDRAIKPGIIYMRELMQAGLFKVHPSCANFLREYSLYSYDTNGKFIDKDNHYIDSARYCLMAIDKFGVSETDHKSKDKTAYEIYQEQFLEEQDVYG